MISFHSTRQLGDVTASQAILRGLAEDGGLFVPSEFPALPDNWVELLAPMSYVERASVVLRAYLSDFSVEEIDASLQAAYGENKFDDERIAPVRALNHNTSVLELFHGPTLAFKDMALQLLPQLLVRSGKKQGEKREISVLVATSGDTGKAALEGLKDVPGTSCTVFYPEDGVSDVQKLQMTTTGGQNTHVIAVNGNFDDAQSGVKALFASADFAEKLNAEGKVLSSANSINFGRLVPQIVYYISAYVDLVKSEAISSGDAVNFVVPTGNFGNILAAYYARCMGLPVNKLICASNANRVLTDFFTTGAYDIHRPFYKTTSPSMDILISSNLERMLFELSGRNCEQTALWMQQLKESGHYQIEGDQLAQLGDVFSAGYADDKVTAEEIRRVFENDGYLMDTHTAVASRVLEEYRQKTGDETTTVIVSTASPYKFAADVLAALEGKQATEGLDAFACAEKLEQLSARPVPPQVKMLRTLPVRHTAKCEKDVQAMETAVFQALNQ